MKKIILCLLTMTSSLCFAQTVKDGKVSTDSRRLINDQSFKGRTEGWLISGNNSILFSQAAFSNWIAGGVNSTALNANVDYEFNLTRNKHIWDNRIILAYGLQKNKGDESRKNNDIIDLASSYGYNIKKNWYLAGALTFKTQFTNGYDYSVSPYKKISNFMAPGYLTVGFGLDYKPNENFQINIHPFTSRVTFVLDKDLQYKGSFGLENDGDKALYELGAYLGARYKFTIMEGITFDNRLGIFSNYLDEPLNMDFAYAGLLDFKVNRFISAQLALNLLYDEDQIKKVQVRQTLGIGFTYKFDNKPKEETTALLQATPIEQPIFDTINSQTELTKNTMILKNDPLLNKTALVNQ